MVVKIEWSKVPNEKSPCAGVGRSAGYSSATKASRSTW